MSIKALIKITDRDEKGNLVEYDKDEIISGFTSEEEKRLIANGSAEAVETVDTSSEINTEGEKEEGQDATGSPNTGYPGA